MIHSHRVNYQEPVAHCDEDSTMVNFVDDGTAYVADHSPEVKSQKLSNHYSCIEGYMHANKLVINADKSHLIVMPGQGQIAARRMDVQVKAGQDIMEKSVSKKLLEGVIHNSGRWNKMIISSKMSITSQQSGRLMH